MHELNPEECRALLANGEVAHVAVIADGEPYVTPVSYVMVGGDLFFRTGEGRRLHAIRASERVCVEVCRTDPGAAHWDSVVAWGKPEVIADEQLAADVATNLLEKYRPLIPSPLAFSWAPPGGSRGAATVRIALDTLSGRASSGGFGPEMRPGRL